MEGKESTVEAQKPVAGLPALGLGAFCAFGVFIIAIVVGMSSVLAGKKLILKYASDAPAVYNYDSASADLALQAMGKITAFAEKAAGSGKIEFSLGLDELNSLLAYQSQLSGLKNFAKFSKIERDLFVDFSYPVEKIDGLQDAGKGKYLNGSARIAVYVKKREFKMQLQEVLQNGKPLEIDSLNALQDRNLLQHFDFYEEEKSRFDLVADVLFKEDKIYFRNWREKIEK